MKPLFFCALALLAVSSAFGALAPDSLAGKVYRDSFINITTRSSSEKTIIFDSETQFTYLKWGVGNALALAYPYKILLRPRPDGTYVYQRMGDASARVTLTFPDGSVETLELNFTSPGGGETPGSTVSSGSTFTLTNLADTQNAPALNMSTRGRVAPGQPLIVGFVVPGAPISGASFNPPAGFRQREALIRVVGPGLAGLGVENTWADPEFDLVPAPGTVNSNNGIHYRDWSAIPPITSGVPPVFVPDADTEAAFRKIFARSGAFPLPFGSKDAAEIARLNPGAYTVVAATVRPDDPGGEVIIEIYFLP